MRYFLSAILLLMLLFGCADSVNVNNVDPDLSITITNPLENDSIGFRGDRIEYKYTPVSGMIFIELYVNNIFMQNFAPANNTDPVINFIVDSVLTGQKIEIYLIYYDKNGKSTKSNIVRNVLVTEDRSLPSAPFNLNVITINNTTLNVSWQDTSRYAQEYEIWRSTGETEPFIKHLTAPAEARNVNDNSIEPGKSYFYKIRVLSKNGYSEFSSVKGSAGSGSSDLPAPGNLSAVVKDFKVIELKWNDNSTDENYFEIERRGEWTEFETVGYTLKNAEVFVDSGTGIAGGTEYYYRVKAVSAKDSSLSNEVYILMPPYFLRAPSLTSVNNISSGYINLEWRDNDQNYADFIIERKEAEKDFLQIETVSPYIHTYTDTVHPGQTYTYRIKQDDGILVSSYSEELIITTKIIPLTAPQNLNGYYDGSNMIMNWEYNDIAENFIVEKKDSTIEGSYLQAAVLDGSDRQYIDNSTDCQHVYVYRVKAVDAYTSSPYSVEKVIKNWKTCP